MTVSTSISATCQKPGLQSESHNFKQSQICGLCLQIQNVSFVTSLSTTAIAGRPGRCRLSVRLCDTADWLRDGLIGSPCICPAASAHTSFSGIFWITLYIHIYIYIHIHKLSYPHCLLNRFPQRLKVYRFRNRIRASSDILAPSLDNPVRFRWNRGRTDRTRYGLFQGTTTEG